MTASDSDCSIDWLASDDEDSSCGESASESDCDGQAAAARPSTPEPEPEPSGAEPCGVLRAQQGRLAGDTREEGDSDDSDSAESRDRPSGGQEARAAPVCHSGLKRPCCPGAKLPEAEAGKLSQHKCRELQCYILPLTSILNSLHSGRYRERLSSFQESVAMDRIRRILGVLQNPCMGERYINIILKVEVMLKTWFPNVEPVGTQAGDPEQEATPSKRQKVSPVNTAPSIAASLPASPCALPSHSKARQASEASAPCAHSATSLKRLHHACPPACSSSPAEEPRPRAPRLRAPPRARAVTQDNAVSSSTDPDAEGGHPAPGVGGDLEACPLPPQSRPPPSTKISAPCLERLLKSTESIVTRRGVGGAVESGWS